MMIRISKCSLQFAVILLLLGHTAAADTSIDLTRFTGHVLYLDFWASWCAPCKQSFPWMQSMHDAYQARGLAVMAINLDHDRDSADRFIAQQHPTFELGFDPKGGWAEHFEVRVMPTSMLIDKHGKTRYIHSGFRSIDEAEYEHQILALLAED